MVLKSQTYKGKGSNELRFEDKNDQQEVFIHAQKDQNNVVEHNETTRVGNDRTENIGNDETISIGHDRIESVGNDETISIGHDQSNTIGNDQNNKIVRNRISHIGKDEIIKIDNHRKLDVYADQYQTTGGHHTHKVEGDATLKAGQKIIHRTKVYKVTGSDKVSLLGPSGTITLDLNGITLKGNVMVKGSINISSGGGGGVPAPSAKLNKGLKFDAEKINWIEIGAKHADRKTPVVGAPYSLTFFDGSVIEGKLDANGHVRHENIPASIANLYIGEDEREWKAFEEAEEIPNPLYKPQGEQ